MRKKDGKLQQKINIRWSANFAYAIGLITSDGCLCKDGRHISLVSKDKEQIDSFKKALALDNKTGMSSRGGETQKKYYTVRFGDKVFYEFLYSIGLSQRKSNIISAVKIPKKYFADFIRGEFDGDGSFYTAWDKRWPNSFVFHITFASGSIDFVKWMQSEMRLLYGLKGFITKGKGVYQLRYVKGDSTKLFDLMYYRPGLLYLSRKHDKIEKAIHLNQSIQLSSVAIKNLFSLVKIMPS